MIPDFIDHKLILKLSFLFINSFIYFYNLVSVDKGVSSVLVTVV